MDDDKTNQKQQLPSSDGNNYRLRGFHKHNFDTPNDPIISGMISGATTNRTMIRKGTAYNHLPSVAGMQYGSGQDYISVKKPRRYEKSTERMKRLKELQAAEEDLRLHKERRNTEKEQEIVEKKKDLEMLKKYNPWGGGGGGAPRFSNSGTVLAQRHKFTDETSPTNDEETFNPFGKPGGGAPRRSDLGHIVTSITADPNMRFQKQLKKEVERSLRYKPVVNNNNDQPFGKVAGTPRQSILTDSEIEIKTKEQKLKEQYAHRLESQMQERVKTGSIKPSFKPYFPWGRDQVNRDISGKIIAPQKKKLEEVEVGAWLKGLGERRATKHTSILPPINDNKNQEGYNPWGRPGGGAPLIKRDGQTFTTVFGNFDYKSEKEEDTTNKDTVVSTATWVGRGKVGRPSLDPMGAIGGQPIQKQTSDITMKRLDIRRAPVQEVVPYYSQYYDPGKYEAPYHTPKPLVKRRPEDMIKRLSNLQQ